jgi:hypothetical protein
VGEGFSVARFTKGVSVAGIAVARFAEGGAIRCVAVREMSAAVEAFSNVLAAFEPVGMMLDRCIGLDVFDEGFSIARGEPRVLVARAMVFVEDAASCDVALRWSKDEPPSMPTA